jgi:hypothetical protein
MTASDLLKAQIKRIKAQIKRTLANKGYLVRRLDHLTYLADLFGSDKGTRFSAHLYSRIYEKLFKSMQNDKLAIVEIGLHRPDADRRRDVNAAEGSTSVVASMAPSLEMWTSYFPNAEIFGFDIDDFCNVKVDRCKIVRGDMSSRDDLAELVRTVGRPIDILIDDGSHVSHHQQIALGYLFPYLRTGGMYVIEDLHWQDESLERSEFPKTRDILRRFQVDGSLESPVFRAEEQRYVQEHVNRVYLFDSFTNDVHDSTDALAVLVKK